MTGTGRLTRRTLLRAGAATVTATAATGCAEPDRAIQVAVVWNAEELDHFREVLAGYPRPVQLISAGDDLDAFLRARHLAGTSPDVAILPRPGLVREYARLGWLAALDAHGPTTPPAGTPPNLHDRLRDDNRQYGVWVKLAHKSLFWHLPEPAFDPPETWEKLVELTTGLGREAIRSGGPAPLAIGAADGWVLTDWFENVLADIASGATYDALAGDTPNWRGPEVREALDRLAGLWSIPGAFPGGGRRALLTQFAESVIQVMTTRKALLVFESDFVEGVATTFRPDVTPAWIPFPRGPNRTTHPLVVGGDAAVVFKASRYGDELVRWLVEPNSFAPWLDRGGYLSPNLDLAPDPGRDQLRRKLAAQISAARDNLRFDLSDQLPGSFTGSDGVGIWRIMQDFFSDVTGDRLEGAVGRATDALAGAARTARIGR
ncbi:ABC transporter substrate-binding protein [Micromonospora sp. NBC_01699]|uniref:ABC transporter substrate-binding protein n=1 Tax=Micromonospora sp. NBC_01699 TaxID=2975984 RepID=UPI002E2F543A|nr:ABC transporter substrate-binding protein [Micromonospora sp. NBC_01699]